jgi:tRNA1Val (adenine37-N6)-methyltransferase
MKQLRPTDIEIRPGESIDDFLDGRLKLVQSNTGYRFSIDAILLSEFVTIKVEDTVTDLGMGCGIIPLILLITKPVEHVFGLEIQEELASQAIRNAFLNGFSDRMSVIMGDIRHPPFGAAISDVVVCNPPYRKVDSGRINPDQQRAIARHEIMASLDDILQAARHILRPKGRLAMVYPSERLAGLMTKMRNIGIEPKRIRIIYPGESSAGKRVMIEGFLGGREGLKILPPLFDQGDYSI